MSAATIDCRLQPFRLQLVRGFGATKPGSLLKSQVPVRTWTPWDDQRLGFLEIDLVAHCGSSNRGQYLFTLVATDVVSGSTECMGVPSKRQDDVFVALEAVSGRLPFVLLGLDSDNDGELIGGTLDLAGAHRQRAWTVELREVPRPPAQGVHELPRGRRR